MEMRNRMAYILTSITVGMIAGCKKPYNPPVISSSVSYLVIEGVINAGADSTTIKLSRTVSLSNKVTVNPVSQATVMVESDQNVVYPLTEASPGSYVAAGLNLDNSRTYRLSIKTPDNKQYYSDFVPVSTTPPIDSIGFNIVNDPVAGVQIYANTHNSNNNTRYYRWDYDETWQFHTKYQTFYQTNGTAIVQRVQSIYLCYASDVSSDIVLGSSAKLQNNTIYQAPIVLIPSTSEKIEMDYSILLREYTLTPGAYNFWTNLKTNTEQLGGIFDAQPSQIEGNIHNINNSTEPVIGYVSVCTISSKRIFITKNQLPAWVPTYPYYCEIDTVESAYDYLQQLPLNSPIIPLSKDGETFSYYTCVDCTIRGTLTAPPFWK